MKEFKEFKGFINELSSTLGIERRELIEKDIILHNNSSGFI